MVTRQCTHCEAEIEVPSRGRINCPVCGLDPDLPPLAFRFTDAPAFFLGGDPRRLQPIPVVAPDRSAARAVHLRSRQSRGLVGGAHPR
jgi:hypothetical protein